MEERWEVLTSYSNYAISNTGKIKRLTKGGNTHAGRILNPKPTGRGYLQVCFYIDGKRKRPMVHTLVLETFGSPKPRGQECNHIDGNKTNNHIENLEWVSRRYNVKHAFDIGTHISVKGEKHGRAKLSERDVHAIRELLSKKTLFKKQIAKMFGVTWGAIRAIETRKRWGHLN